MDKIAGFPLGCDRFSGGCFHDNGEDAKVEQIIFGRLRPDISENTLKLLFGICNLDLLEKSSAEKVIGDPPLCELNAPCGMVYQVPVNG